MEAGPYRIHWLGPKARSGSSNSIESDFACEVCPISRSFKRFLVAAFGVVAAISVAEPFQFRRTASRIRSKAELPSVVGEGRNRCASLEALIKLAAARRRVSFQHQVAEPSNIASRGAFWLEQSYANPSCSDPSIAGWRCW